MTMAGRTLTVTDTIVTKTHHVTKKATGAKYTDIIVKHKILSPTE